jgi:(p)ppGpp synthase/HD superfamily hydrolase
MQATIEETHHRSIGGACGSADVRSCASARLFAGLPVAQSALALTAARHAGQYREVDRAPFIVHPIEVAQLLATARREERCIAAGLLHDVLEKTTTTRAELRRRFGTRIAQLVESVSGNQAIADDQQRKRQLRDRVADGDADTLAIFAADKISKVRELALLPSARLDDATRRAKLSHYQASLAMLRQAAPDLALVDQLHAELNRLTVLRPP